MKNHTFNLSINRNPQAVHKVTIPADYREKIESGDTIDEHFKVIGHSKVNADQVIVTSHDVAFLVAATAART